jgi:hypothetical protein
MPSEPTPTGAWFVNQEYNLHAPGCAPLPAAEVKHSEGHFFTLTGEAAAIADDVVRLLNARVGGAAPSAPTTDAPTVDKGRLWALIRDVLSQGTAIERDNVEGCYPTYEAWSARLDAAARERVADFTALLRGGATAPTPDPTDDLREDANA